MDGDRGQRVKAIFLAALDVDPQRRSGYLQEQCGDDAALREDVAALLAADARPGGTIDSTSVAAAWIRAAASEAAAEEPAPAHQRIGPYRIVRTLGAGGMGTVYEAVQERPQRRVALKLLHAALVSPHVTRRFVREAELLARLEHPHIARVYDAGTHDDGFGGAPYFAMELVQDARPITEYARVRGLTVRQRLDLILAVCDALHYGHLRGVIHRDVKPGNLLVGADGSPRVIDFGVARTTGADLSIASLQTTAGEIIGTLRYMSPEQCRGDANEVDARSDVYSLGVVIHELLAGRLPYDLDTTSVFDIPRAIREVAPRHLPPVRELRGDLDTIVLKALEKDPARRYQSVSELAADLRRHLAGSPIEAKRDHTWYILRMTLRRHRSAAAVASAFFALVSIAAVALGVMYSRAEHRAEALRRSGYLQSIALAENALASSRTDELRMLLDRCPADLRGWEWHHLATRADESVATLEGAEYGVAALSPDGRVVASAGRGGFVDLWDVEHRQRLGRHPIAARLVDHLAFSPDEDWLGVGARGGGTSLVMNVRTGDTVFELPSRESLGGIAFTPEGRRCVTGSLEGTVAVWDLVGGGLVRRLAAGGRGVTALGISTDGTILAAGRDDGSIEAWEVETGRSAFGLTEAHPTRVTALVFDPGGTRLLSAGWDTVKTWDRRGQPLGVRRIEGDAVKGLALSADGRALAVVTPLAIEIRDTETGAVLRRLIGHDNGSDAAFLPNGGQLISWSRQAGTIKVWDLARERGAFVLGRHDNLAESVAASPDGRWIASAERGGTVIMWNAGRNQRHTSMDSGTARVYRLAFSPGGGRLAAACDDGAIRIWSVPGGTLERELRRDRHPIMHAGWADDDLLLAGSGDGALALWSGGEGRLLHTIDAGQGAVMSVACRADGALVATGGYDGTVKVWKLQPLRLASTLTGHEKPVQDLAWSPDGATLASAGGDFEGRLWDIATGQTRTVLRGHTGGLKAIDFSPDGTRLATSAWEGEIRLWDSSSGQCVLRLRGHIGVVKDIAFTADGRRLVSVGDDRTLRVWEALGPQDDGLSFERPPSGP